MLFNLLSFVLTPSYFFYKKKTTVCAIVIAYVGRFDPQFVEFRDFKVRFSVLSFVLLVFKFVTSLLFVHRLWSSLVLYQKC
jgi:hypothetical protein